MDIEKHITPEYGAENSEPYVPTTEPEKVQLGYEYRGPFAPILRFEDWLDQKMGVESHAVERKLPESRRMLGRFNGFSMCFFWASGVMNSSSFSSGMLGWVFGLDLKQSLIVIFFGNLIGGAVTAYCATFGAATGLRQMSVSRYSFGLYPNMMPALLNTVQQLGWSAVSCITGGVTIEAVSNGTVSVIPGIIIVAVVSFVMGIFGLRVILFVENFAWFIYLFVFLAIIGETGYYADNTTPAKAKGTTNLAGSVLSFLAVVYGWTASWCPLASDYYVNYPANVSRVKVFLSSLIGLCIFTSISMWAGAIVASSLDTRPEWKAIYEEKSFGFLLMQMLYPWHFAKFLLVMLVVAAISLNSMSTYSAPISLLQVSPYVAYVPRFVWQIIGFGIVIALGIAGRDNLTKYLENFLLLLGYWCTSYASIIFMEHVIFRKANFANYDLNGYNDPKRLPHGIAAGTVFLVGVVCWVMGMYETWYTGPLARLFGDYPGDLGNEFTLVFTVASYIPLRYLEYKIFKK